MSRPGAAILALALALAACARLAPAGPADPATLPTLPSAPTLALGAKAERYQARVAALHQMPEGVIRYRFVDGQPRDDYGDLPDGAFFTGLYLASQALRLAATGEPAARQEVLRSLDGMALLLEVTGQPGLLARWVDPGPHARGPRWRPSETRPGYFWRSDVSKDQLAGYAAGLCVALALVPDAETRDRAGALAVPLAERLARDGQRIRDWDGRQTRHGDLRAHIALVPIGVNALVSLAVAKAADAARGDDRRSRALDAAGFLRAAHAAYWRAPGSTKRVNQNMAYVALLGLLLLETDPARARALADSEAALWETVRGEQNAFFAGVHVLASGDAAAAAEARRGLAEFPEDKRPRPVDLRRPELGFETSWWNDPNGWPRATRPVPLYLRAVGSNLWVSDPRLLVKPLGTGPRTESSGVDYLLAYWLARALGVATASD